MEVPLLGRGGRRRNLVAGTIAVALVLCMIASFVVWNPSRSGRAVLEEGGEEGVVWDEAREPVPDTDEQKSAMDTLLQAKRSEADATGPVRKIDHGKSFLGCPFADLWSHVKREQRQFL